MIPHNPLHLPAILSLKPCRSQIAKACYATIRSLRQPPRKPTDWDELDPSDNDFILSILRAKPSLRDTKGYFESFGARTVISSILNPIYRRTALVKLQCPFTDKQLNSIARGMVYLEKLGLVSVVVIDHVELARGVERERAIVIEETMRVVSALEAQGARARPVLGAVVRLGPMPGDHSIPATHVLTPPEAHLFPADLAPIRSSLRAGEIPVLPPFALDSFSRSVRIDANDVIAALARGMVEAAELDDSIQSKQPRDPHADYSEDINLVPLRLMIINREGGVPSYARAGYPHLLVNLSSEYDFIRDTFDPSWSKDRPSALSNLALARMCLSYMPPTSSAIMVSHRSPSSLIGNLITNKPAVSSSLPHALLQGNRKLTPDTPTLIRRGQPIRVIRDVANVNKTKLTHLLETSFKQKLDAEPFYKRLEKYLDFIIVAGDYVGAAIVTDEPNPDPNLPPISYLDKFAVLPDHQGDGTVDFLWVALHDESYGLGHPFSVNPNGGKEGKGEGRDLVWRSRANNPINRWYFERSSGHMRLGSWVLFWCDAEKRLKLEEGQRADAGLSFIENWEAGRLAHWANVVTTIPSAWR
ncbi:hypothetical protein J3A83DRAFT_3281637 [Scleroderma citrinum]